MVFSAAFSIAIRFAVASAEDVVDEEFDVEPDEPEVFALGAAAEDIAAPNFAASSADCFNLSSWF